MNAEYLLDAIGRLDDDLVREAERYRRPRVRHGLLLSWAASFAVVIALSYVLTHLGMGGSAPGPASGGGNGAASAQSGNAAEGDDPLGGVFDQTTSVETEPASPGDNPFTDTDSAGAEAPGGRPDGREDAWVELNGPEVTISMRRDGTEDRHIFRPRGGEDQVLDELPEGCVKLLNLERPGKTEEADVPYTNRAEYAGRPVWLWMEDPETTVLYVGLPEGGYLEFR